MLCKRAFYFSIYVKHICKSILFELGFILVLSNDTQFIPMELDYGICSFEKIIGIPMGTNLDPLLADIYLYMYSCEAEFMQSLLSAGKKQ